MNRPAGRALLGLSAAAFALAAPVEAQDRDHIVGVSGVFQGYSLAPELGAEAANLLLTPLAYTGEFLNGQFRIDAYGAWGLGQVERGGTAYELNGLLDTRVRFSYRVGPWGVVTMGVSLPTGKETLNSEESVVASVLSTDLLGFRESTWGQGGALTPGFAAATSAGSWNLGAAISYRATREYEPTTQQEVVYQPGNEFRIRAGADRNIGESGRLALGAAVHNYDTDQLDGRNLYQAGYRLRGDASYSWRSGRSTWSVYAADIWRSQGEAIYRLDLQDDPAAPADSTITETVGSQNLLLVGVSGVVPVSTRNRIRPQASFRMQTVEQLETIVQDQNRVGTGSGWLINLGGDFPLRWGTTDFFPKVIGSWGRMKDPQQTSRTFWGGELSLTVRWGR
jgi:hypothetical protein